MCITDKSAEAASLGSLVSLRAEATRTRAVADGARRPSDSDELAISVRAIKDKRRGPGWTQSAKRRAPAGLR